MTPEEQEQHYLNTLPVFVSIPRAGCNWLQAVMELYFDRHRVMKHPNTPSWMEGDPHNNPMWAHTHDNFWDTMDITIPEDQKAVFLYRDPTDTIFSLSKLIGSPLHETSVDKLCYRFNRCYNKWATPSGLLSRGCLNPLVVNYDEVKRDPHKVMKTISEYYGKGFSQPLSEYAFETVGSIKNTNDKNGDERAFKNKESGTDSYLTHKQRFREMFETYINNKVKVPQ